MGALAPALSLPVCDCMLANKLLRDLISKLVQCRRYLRTKSRVKLVFAPKPVYVSYSSLFPAVIHVRVKTNRSLAYVETQQHI